MIQTKTVHLKIVAALVWCSGGFVLSYKAQSMLSKASELTQDNTVIWLTVLTGLIVGGLKVKFLFIRFCTRNLARIHRLNHPKIWQCFRPGFLFFLMLMILFGKFMTEKAEGNYSFLLGMALLDISLAVALLGSTRVFWSDREVGLSANK